MIIIGNPNPNPSNNPNPNPSAYLTIYEYYEFHNHCHILEYSVTSSEGNLLFKTQTLFVNLDNYSVIRS